MIYFYKFKLLKYLLANKIVILFNSFDGRLDILNQTQCYKNFRYLFKGIFSNVTYICYDMSKLSYLLENASVLCIVFYNKLFNELFAFNISKYFLLQNLYFNNIIYLDNLFYNWLLIKINILC